MDTKDSFDKMRSNTEIITSHTRRSQSHTGIIEKVLEARVALAGLPHDQMPDPSNDAKDDVSAVEEPGATDQPILPGMRINSKELYRENRKDAWDDWSPDDIDTDPEHMPEAKTYALIVRREKSVEQKPSLILHSVTIQSPLIRNVLGIVFDGYRGMTTKLKDLTFNAPFHEFFYRWDSLQQQIEEEKDDLVLEHMRLLQSVISGEIQPHLGKRQELLDNGLVTFEYLWALFQPDDVIYHKHSDGQDRLYTLVDSCYRKIEDSVFLILTCRYIDCDGVGFGYVTTSLTLGEFDGIKPISQLSIMPIILHSQIAEIWERLWKRGRRFVELNGFHYRSYSGLCTVNEGSYGSIRNQNIDDGRIIIDTRMWSTYNPDQASSLEALDDTRSSNGEDLFSLFAKEFLGDDDHPYASTSPMEAIARKALRSMTRRRRPNNRQAKNPTSLTDDQVVLCAPIVRGYCLTSKKWARFHIDNVREIQWNLEAFHRLVLPHDYKEIIWAFVESQLSREKNFDDVVQGKGQGIIMLLSGEPGVGKTLTAESVAEEMRKPLYSMSAGELGDSASKVEQQLHRVLELSAKWGAILLIDECDIFLEQRTTSDLERNKLVSVFLRLLEYYKGVMFLTTNRVSTFDAAFQSRIHLTIDYPKLDFPSKMLIWKTFVRPRSDSSQYKSNIEVTGLRSLAKMDMNGREIKNTVKTARLLASQKGVPLAMEHVATVLRVKDGSPGVEKTPNRMTGLMRLMLLPFRSLVLFLVLFLHKRLASLRDKWHLREVSEKDS